MKRLENNENYSQIGPSHRTKRVNIPFTERSETTKLRFSCSRINYRNDINYVHIETV